MDAGQGSAVDDTASVPQGVGKTSLVVAASRAVETKKIDMLGMKRYAQWQPRKAICRC